MVPLLLALTLAVSAPPSLGGLQLRHPFTFEVGSGGSPVPPPPPPEPAAQQEVPPPPGLGSYQAPPMLPDLTFRMAQYSSRQKSAAVAFLLEFLTLPGIGCLYANAWLEAGIQWAAIAVSVTLIVIGEQGRVRSSSLVLGGGLLFVGARLFGIVASMLGVSRFNAELREELHLDVALAPTLLGDGGTVALALRF